MNPNERYQVRVVNAGNMCKEQEDPAWLSQLNDDNYFSDLHTAAKEVNAVSNYFSKKHVIVELVDHDSVLGPEVLAVLRCPKTIFYPEWSKV